MSQFDIKSKKNVLTVSAVVLTALVVGLIVNDHTARERATAQTSLAAVNATSDGSDSTATSQPGSASASKSPNPLLALPKDSKVTPGEDAAGTTTGVNSDGISTLQSPPPANSDSTSVS